MQKACGNAQTSATESAARSCNQAERVMRCGTIVPTADDFAVMVRALWPIKGPAALVDYCSRHDKPLPDRTARSYAAADRECGMSVLWMLIESPEGWRVISYIANRTKPTWWINLQRECELATMATDIFRRAGVILNEGQHAH